ncbi:MAG: MBL-fold metallo-hydrolase superfamily [Rhodanobacteraceae bacterium]|jgi:glyoxylase-like metal-dependent hydrolase (beta-lactamase superfamily II)|nr:MAG: MBL-fold metallo-hydrolase superfamily [Rhodanobacteraceae bacterium]
MAIYEPLNDGIVCIDTAQHRQRMAACYLIGSDGHYAFVECGTSLSVPLLLETLADLRVPREAVDYVMPTHVHLDHAGGAGALMRELPNARLVIHPRGARHLIDPSVLIAGATAVYGEEAMRATYGDILPVSQSRVIVADIAADRDFELKLGDRRLLFIDAPGHAKHHYAIWDEASRGWFTGDVFGLSYREFDHAGRNYMIPTTSPVQFDPVAWQTTLARILARQPAHVYLTHYSRIDAVDSLAADLREGLAAYQRIARANANAPDRHARLYAELMDFHLGQLRERGNPLSEARARAVLDIDVEINAQGLEVWLDREAGAARH